MDNFNLRGSYTCENNKKDIPYICVATTFALFISFYFLVNKTKSKYLIN